MTNKELQQAKDIIGNFIDTDVELSKSGFVIFPAKLKILNIGNQTYTAFYNDSWFWFDIPKQKFDRIKDIIVHSKFIESYLCKNLDGLSRFLWFNDYIKAYTVIDVTHAKSLKCNVIAKETDFELLDLEEQGTENVEKFELRVFENTNYWLFKFSEVKEVIINCL